MKCKKLIIFVRHQSSLDGKNSQHQDISTKLTSVIEIRSLCVAINFITSALLTTWTIEFRTYWNSTKAFLMFVIGNNCRKWQQHRRIIILWTQKLAVWLMTTLSAKHEQAMQEAIALFKSILKSCFIFKMLSLKLHCCFILQPSVFDVLLYLHSNLFYILTKM